MFIIVNSFWHQARKFFLDDSHFQTRPSLRWNRRVHYGLSHIHINNVFRRDYNGVMMAFQQNTPALRNHWMGGTDMECTEFGFVGEFKEVVSESRLVYNQVYDPGDHRANWMTLLVDLPDSTCLLLGEARMSGLQNVHPSK